MGNHNLAYLNHCKKRIEAELGWSHASQDWKQRDYLNLIALVESKTGISLSLSTIKRLWHQDYDGTPHPTTLDALARFLDYEDWLSFQENERSKLEARSESTQQLDQLVGNNQSYGLIGIVVILVLAAFLWAAVSKSGELNEGVVISSQAIPFSAQNTKVQGVPNTVIFKFDLSEVKADSFFIQQSWNTHHRERISKNDSVLTSIYYYPGVHTAKLIANDSIISTTSVRVYSKAWIAAIRNGAEDLVPTYLPLVKSPQGPNLSISKSQLADHKLDISEQTMLNYVFIDDFAKKVAGDNFALSIRLKADSLLNLTCPRIGIMIVGELDMHAITLLDKGCVHQAFAKFGETRRNGRNSDLSALGVKPYEWQSLRIVTKNNKGQVYLQKKLLLEIPYDGRIGNIVGFNIYFTGIGRIDSLLLEDNTSGRNIYSSAVD
ncbi:MAG: hypothetical protein KTR30_00590 [Saprospiraceae bacterium]|nr:hypothetical protein [Saprospiraceae bacterium]